MNYLSAEAKEAIITKALSCHGVSLKEIAEKNHVPYSTLNKWLRDRKAGLPLLSKGRPGRPSLKEEQIPPLQHLLATASLDEGAVGAYCREQGIHTFQLKQWQDELMNIKSNKTQSSQLSEENKQLRLKNKKLEQELKRKDKALAEASALLILKKKADLIWGESQDD